MEKLEELPITFEELLKDVEKTIAASAYVLIEANPSEIPSILKALASIPNVKSADVVTGIYDIIVYLVGQDQNEIGKVVIRDINSIPGVKKATTCMVVKL
ncbi:Lrp/AsnC family transcriptional regulator [Sulfurihydrogenibium subterraneum]|uniref:Lrp/AsnC family transcriptional regulator n=1 Tax=Sulfurihydrogenibium subterraneum TaxID=171121 RepID=UPI0004901EA8|nr:Lrp/AsnC ligand binding domain-containing protein [Sulfurihydrogenibium subterraneum]